MRRLAVASLAALVLLTSSVAANASPTPTPSPSISIRASLSSSAAPLTFAWPGATYSPPTASPAPPWQPTPEPIPTVEQAKAWALAQLGPEQFACLDHIVMHESRWNPTVWNGRGSGAYGLPQAVPADRMASAGADWQTNPITQLRWMIGYLDKYGGPCGGWAFWAAHGWY